VEIEDAARVEEARSLRARRTAVTNALRRTWALLAVALLIILPAGGIAFGSYVANVYPLCRGTLEASASERAATGRGETSAVFPLDVAEGGFAFHLDTVEAEPGRVTWAKIVRVETDANGGTLECGGVVLRDAGVSNAGGAMMALGGGAFAYVDKRWSVEGTVLRAIEHPTRHVQRGRLLARRHLPASMVLVAMLALGFAAGRARSASLYATRLHAWNEARLEPSGRITTEGGEQLGVVAGSAPVVAVDVLVSPAAGPKREVYRELPVVARGEVALGSHAGWSEVTRRHLRDARVLAVVSASCAVAALGARMLGG
jgi:hypothetical protein